MKTLVITMMILISILLIIIGCGGSDGVSQPSSVSNPSSVNANTCSISITVKWPQNGVEGSFTASSGENNSIMASMPVDTERIEFDVWEKDDFFCPLY